MTSIFKWLLPTAAAFGLVVGLAAISVKAQDAKVAKGNINGTVLDKDGKAVEGVTVNLMKPRRQGGGGGGAGGGPGGPSTRASVGNDAIQLQQGPPGQGQRPAPIATATTDKDGKFTMSDIAVGQYMVGVRDDAKKLYGRAPVTVEDGKTAEVEIKCSDTPPQRGPGGPGGGGGGGGRGPGGPPPSNPQ
jgi:hypothetical protein